MRTAIPIGRNMPRYKNWEIWWAYVPFDDKLFESKKRPVLVVLDSNDNPFMLKMTSQLPSGPYDHRIKELNGTGLSKPTTIQVWRAYRLPDSQMMICSGRLHLSDIVDVKRILSNYLERPSD